jgi:adenylosuccinate synthase
VRCFEDLPPAAKNYLGRISQLVGRPVELVSVGPDREQTIFVKP